MTSIAVHDHSPREDRANGPPADIANAMLPEIDFRALLALSHNPYVLLDRDLTLVWMNDAYLRATNRRREDLVGRTMFDAFPSDPESEGRRLLAGSFAQVMRTGEVDEIALIRYDIAAPDGTMETRYWSATHTPLPAADGTVGHILQHTVDVTELHDLRSLRDEIGRDEAGLMQRVQAVQSRNLDLAEETSQLKNLFEQAPGFVAILGGSDHRFVLANNAYRQLVGNQDLIGRTVMEALPEVVEQGFVQLLDNVHATGLPYFGMRDRLQIGSGGRSPAREYYLTFIYQPIFGDDGDVTGVFVQGHDVSEEVEAEERQTLMINELNHRVKNTLAIVQGLAMQSFRQIKGSESARRTFDARLNALSAAHSMLTARNWEASGLIETIRTAVEATAGQDAARFQLTGGDVTLRPQTAVALAMVLHELSTNAIKYGAISVPDGQVNIDWVLEPDGHDRHLILNWVESGGPPVAEPLRRGFGSRLIQRGMSGEPGAKVDLEFHPSGLVCRLRATLQGVGAP